MKLKTDQNQIKEIIDYSSVNSSPLDFTKCVERLRL